MISSLPSMFQSITLDGRAVDGGGFIGTPLKECENDKGKTPSAPKCKVLRGQTNFCIPVCRKQCPPKPSHTCNGTWSFVPFPELSLHSFSNTHQCHHDRYFLPIGLPPSRPMKNKSRLGWSNRFALNNRVIILFGYFLPLNRRNLE